MGLAMGIQDGVRSIEALPKSREAWSMESMSEQRSVAGAWEPPHEAEARPSGLKPSSLDQGLVGLTQRPGGLA